MVRYKTKPGVVQTSVCGEYLLVAAKEAGSDCPYVTVINETSAFLWKQMIPGATLDELERAVQREYEVADAAAARAAIEGFLRKMQELNYLLTDEQGDKHEEQ